jgi:hypothetical protein
MSYLVQVLLPLYSGAGRPIPSRLLKRTARELTEKFGGLTAHTRAPVEGVWKKAGRRVKDDLLIYEVLTTRLDRRWWKACRGRLERDFEQDKVQITVYTVQQL